MAQAHEQIRALREKQQRCVTQAREHLDKIADGMPEADRLTEERAHDAAMAEYDALQGRIDREEKLIEAEERAAAQLRDRRPGGDDVDLDPGRDGKDLKKKNAFRNYLRFGMDALDDETRRFLGPMVNLAEGEARGAELRAQGVVDATAGGYLVPQGFSDQLMVSMKAYGPMNDDGVVYDLPTATGNEIPWPTLDDTNNKGRRVSENTQVNPANLALGVRRLFAYKYTTDVVLVSSELLQDSAIDPETVVNDAMGERMGRILNQERTTGTGGSMPNGIVYAAAISVAAAASAAIAFDDVLELEHGVDPAYRTAPGVGFMFADGTLKALRKLKDGQGQYLWQPASVIAKAPPAINGYRYQINQDMAAIGSGNASMTFGDMKRYVSRRVKQFAVRRLNERYADNDQVGFIGFGRYDGNLIDLKALAKLTHP